MTHTLDYNERAARALAAELDWNTLGLFHSHPKEYHFTRKGLPDKRYKNYLEVLAYLEAEQEEYLRFMFRRLAE